ncbi:MAG: MXAN_5187 C-terminal domain-containing protein [Desulfuromonadales bacterium]
MSTQSQKIKKLNEIERQLRKQAQQPLTGRANLEGELQKIEEDFKALEIAYEQYFIGLERFEPSKERQILALRLRRMINTHITQTDLRFRVQNVNSRFQSYSAYWDRILRLIEEGRYQRQLSHMRWAEKSGAKVSNESARSPEPADPLERIYRELIQAHESCRIPVPGREQVAEFLKRQADAIRERFGDRPVDMLVVVESGKPKIKVRAKG